MPIITACDACPLVHSVLLCSWDHIFGPLLEHAWCARRDTACFQYVARQSLDGEIFMEHPEAEAQSKLAVYPEFGVIAKGVTFTATPDATGPTVFALTLVLPRECQPLFMALHGELEARVRVLAGRAKVFLDATSRTAVRRIGRELVPLLRDLNSVAAAAAAASPYADLALLSGRAPPEETRFLALAATAMLQAMSQAVVLCAGEAAAHSYVSTLARLLVLPGQRRLVRTSRTDDNRHVPGLRVQAVLTGGRPRLYTELERSLLEASGPTAVVDLDRRQVMRCGPAHEFYALRREYLEAVCVDRLREPPPPVPGAAAGGGEAEQEREQGREQERDDEAEEDASSSSALSVSASDTASGNPAAAAATAAASPAGGAPPESATDRFWRRVHERRVPVLRVVRRPAPCVLALVYQAIEVPAPVRGRVLAQSMRLLLRRASMLVTHAEHVLASLARPPASLASFAPVRARVRKEAGLLDDEDDFLVYVAMAETFRPGLHRMLYGDPGLARAKVSSAFGGF